MLLLWAAVVCACGKTLTQEEPCELRLRAAAAASSLRYHYVATSDSGTLEGEYSNRFILTQRKDDKTADL